jgi:type I restriction enzyme, S subunit
MNPYPSYKETGVEWIGEIPSGWDVVSIKRLCSVKRGSSPRPIDDPKFFDEQGEFRWVRISDVSSSERYLEKTTQVLSELGSSLSTKRYPGDIFLSIAGSVGKPIISKIKCCIHDGFVWFDDLNIDSEYLYYIFSLSQCFQGLGKFGTQLNLNTETVGSIKIPLMTHIEQQQIVDHLDKGTTKIDSLIEKTQKKIELLKEQRISLIDQVVTKGLNSDVEMKDSGVEWIGEIPCGWEIRRIWSLGKFSKGRGIKKDEVKQNGIPCIRYGEIYTDYDRVVYSPKSFIDEETSQNSEPIKKGDVLFTGSGELLEEIGKSVVYYGDTIVFVGGDIIILQLNDDSNPLFVSYLMNSYTVNSKKTRSGKGGIIVHIYSKQLKDIKVTLPPLQQQQQIVDHLDKETTKIDSTIEKETQRIDLLKEYRQSLISNVVTGKVDVRDEVVV